MRFKELSETVDYVKNNVKYHKDLNPKAWDGDTLRPKIRSRLLEIAKVFVDYLEVDGFNVEDIVLTGSMANYNWTKYSDFDVHVVTDYSDLNADDIAEAFYHAKKKIWNSQHDIMVVGHEVELYVEDTENAPVSGGVYSLLNNQWIRKPEYNPPDINDRAVNAKVSALVQDIDKTISSADSARDIKRIITKLGNMRKAGLRKTGEFGTENLAFKILRNQGYIDRLSKAHLSRQDKELSLS